MDYEREGLGKPWSCCNSLSVLEGTGHSYFVKPSVSRSSGGLQVSVLRSKESCSGRAESFCASEESDIFSWTRMIFFMSCQK